MDVIKTLIFGACSAITLLLSIHFLSKRKSLISLISSLFSLISIAGSSYFWTIALEGSGKPVFLLGYERYPVALYLVAAIVLGNLICTSFSFVFIRRKEVPKKTLRYMQIIAAGIVVAFVLTVGVLTMNNTIVGTWTGDGTMDVPNIPFPLEKATSLQFRANGTVIMTYIASDGEKATITYPYSITADTITVVNRETSYGILFDVRGKDLLFGTKGELGIYRRN